MIHLASLSFASGGWIRTTPVKMAVTFLDMPLLVP